MTAYYNEIDKNAAAWLRELIKAGHIAPGEVDERSIADVKPNELRGFKQCHFFAGIGVWSYALRIAGWEDERPVWTGSCPCQPFSAAGAGAGFDDERHLWPAFFHLIKECKPSIVFGEQVASKAVNPWVDLVQSDLEAVGYRFGAIPFPSAGVGAPHIRDRLYWMGNSDKSRPQGHSGHGSETGRKGTVGPASETGILMRMADSNFINDDGAGYCAGNVGREFEEQKGLSGLKDSFGMAESVGRGRGFTEIGSSSDESFWRDSDWLFCRDGKWRPVEPGTFPLANGSTARVGRLRGYGNAINAQAAKAFVMAYMDIPA